MALTVLAGRTGLALTPLWPPSVVIQIVGLDGMHLGRVRRDGPPGDTERWFAVPLPPRRARGPYLCAHAAAAALHMQAVSATRRLRRMSRLGGISAVS